MRCLNPRDRDIFRIGFESGLRISDILNLRICDVQKNPLEIWESKTKKLRFIKISDDLHRHLTQKYKMRRSFGFDNALECVFRGDRGTGRPIHRASYHKRLKSVSRALRIDFSSHSARKLYAKNLFDEKKSILEVQKALNHKFLTTTATYLDMDADAALSQAEREEGL
jgi:integrase